MISLHMHTTTCIPPHINEMKNRLGYQVMIFHELLRHNINTIIKIHYKIEYLRFKHMDFKLISSTKYSCGFSPSNGFARGNRGQQIELPSP